MSSERNGHDKGKPDEPERSQSFTEIDVLKATLKNLEKTLKGEPHFEAPRPGKSSPKIDMPQEKSIVTPTSPHLSADSRKQDAKETVLQVREMNDEIIKTMTRAKEICKELSLIVREAAELRHDVKQKPLKESDETIQLIKSVESIEASLGELTERVTNLEHSPSESHKVRAYSKAMEEGKSGTSNHPVEIPEASELDAELDDILELLVQHRGSDLHLKAGSPPIVRIEGELIPVGDQALTAKDTQRLILSIMSSEMVRSLYGRNELDFSYDSGSGRFRVNAFLQKSNVSASLRLVRLDIPTFEELCLPTILEKIADFHNGLFLVTGPAGSGKSTTLAAIIDFINENRKLHVITIEDPIEYIFEDKSSIITQREVGIDTESFEAALRVALRQDPNVIMIGELRDLETVKQAVMAAETGHLVLSTLHTPNTIQAIRRLLDFFPQSLQKSFQTSLASTLRGIMSQRLIRRTDEEGRIAAVELFMCTPTISSLVRDGNIDEIYDYIKEGKSEGMITFTESLSRLYKAGLISKEEAMHHAEQYTELRLTLDLDKSGGGAAGEKDSKWWHDKM